MYREMQNRLMARRQGTFEEIQLAKPFSEFGQRNLQALAVAYAESAEERVKKQWDAIFSAGWKEKKPLELPVVCLGGSGTSEETAIVLAAPNRYQLLRAEYWYLYHRFGLNWQRGSQFRTVPDVDGMSYDIQEVEMDGQPVRSVYFNVTIPAEPVDLSLDPRLRKLQL